MSLHSIMDTRIKPFITRFTTRNKEQRPPSTIVRSTGGSHESHEAISVVTSEQNAKTVKTKKCGNFRFQ